MNNERPILHVAKGGGARAGGGGFRSSTPKSSSSKSSSGGGLSKSTQRGNTNKSSTPPKPKPGVSKAAPGSKIKTADGKEIQSSSKKPSNSQYTQSKGIVGDNGYTPRFNNYSAPPGSVVYYQNHSALDYLPWIYLFSQNDSPRYDQATIVQPDGKEVTAKPIQEGVDGMYIFNWFMLIIIILAVIGGIVFAVNKFSNRSK